MCRGVRTWVVFHLVRGHHASCGTRRHRGGAYSGGTREGGRGTFFLVGVGRQHGGYAYPSTYSQREGHGRG